VTASRITAIWLVGLVLVAPVSPARGEPAAGAIYDVAAGYAPLYEGTRGHRVGDPVTILLAESINAAKSVDAKTGKTGGASITPPSQGLLSFLNPNALKASSDSTFTGSGSAAQTSSLNATLSVTIAEVRPNGTAVVHGEKHMVLSQGDEWIRFSGLVRLSDIDQDNTVPSSRVADAQIEYSGKGALQRASKPGWLSLILGFVNPF
jgi:flagellar L-ring protein precursor FlgH